MCIAYPLKVPQLYYRVGGPWDSPFPQSLWGMVHTIIYYYHIGLFVRQGATDGKPDHHHASIDRVDGLRLHAILNRRPIIQSPDIALYSFVLGKLTEPRPHRTRKGRRGSIGIPTAHGGHILPCTSTTPIGSTLTGILNTLTHGHSRSSQGPYQANFESWIRL